MSRSKKWTKKQRRRLVELYRNGVPTARIAAELGRTEQSIRNMLVRTVGPRPSRLKLVDMVRPYVAQHLMAKEVHRKFPDYSYQSIAGAMSKARKEMGLPSANCRAGGPLKLPLLIHDRLSIEAKERGYDTATDLADDILKAVIADTMIDAVLDTPRAAA